MGLYVHVATKTPKVYFYKKLQDIREVKNFISHLLSSVLIPLLIPVYLCCILLFYFPSLIHIHHAVGKWLLFSSVLSGTVLLPFILVFALYKAGIISSLTLYKRSDRFIPQIFSCFLYIVLSAGVIYKMGAANPMSLAMIANTLSVLGITFITRFWKISTHAAGAMGFLSITGMLYARHPAPHFLVVFLVISVLCISVCFARLYLKAHTVSQVIAGGILGLITGASVFYFLA